ncbi:5-(carboxyamino)imidazole ribonucleotide synthase [Maritalea sp.]|uniref:5-(carboxyamino)imidazole ribonucleotide synthase n=1 Tax=Maritalea sp. TaxID=2003361 RepID=UPI003EF7CBC1
MKNKLSTGATIGILGGGQLGRMMALAAHRLGLNTHIYCQDQNSPAFAVTPHKTVAPYEDLAALTRFAEQVDCVTYEFENVPAQTAAAITEAGTNLFPSAKALEISQDRLVEKRFISTVGINVAPFAKVDNQLELEAAAQKIGLPAVLKTRRFGYDGKGQVILKTADDVKTAFNAIGAQPAILEGFVPFDKEISVIIARDQAGHVAAYDPAENVHENHILKTSTVPGNISAELGEAAKTIASQLIIALDYIGVMGVEFFVVPDADGDKLIVNEIAPRVHNSGHWTEAACVVDQFEQHIRAVAGWDLGSAERHNDAVMENLIGDEIVEGMATTESNAQVHNYGKAEIRPGRKMGHINRIFPKNRP